MQIHALTLDRYVKYLQDDVPFAVARYGDGEWLTILEQYGLKNSNGCTFTESLGDDLRGVIRAEYTYEYCVLRIAMRKLRTKVEKWLEENNIGLTWFYGDFLLRANIDGQLFPLIEQLRTRKILYIGPEHCRQLDEFFPYVEYVQVPPIDAHEHKKDIEWEIFFNLDAHDIDFIGISSGLAAKVFIGDMWKYTAGEIPILDFGSMWDGYFGVQSRSYIRRGRVNFDELRRLNFECESVG